MNTCLFCTVIALNYFGITHAFFLDVSEAYALRCKARIHLDPQKVGIGEIGCEFSCTNCTMFRQPEGPHADVERAC